MAGSATPPPPDHVDKPVAKDSGAHVGERLTGVEDPKDPDGLLTLDDVDQHAPAKDAAATGDGAASTP